MPTLQLFISIIILTEFRVVCFACKTISGECNLKRPVVSHLPVRFLQTLLFLVAALLRFFSVLFGRGSGNLEGNVKGPLCKVKVPFTSHSVWINPHLYMHRSSDATLTHRCLHEQEVQKGFHLPCNKSGPNFLLGTSLKRGSLPIHAHTSHLHPCIPTDPVP